jgi:hypothetical protein
VFKIKLISTVLLFMLVISLASAQFQTAEDYYRANSDVFGLFYNTSDDDDFNSPSASQPILSFDESKYSSPEAFMLKKVTYPSGMEIRWDYELDDWYTSRGDAEQPYQGLLNYYTYWRHNGNTEGFECESNYGGGVRVNQELVCNGFHSSVSTTDPNCYTITYDYTMPEPLYDCVSRSSGAIDFVPVRQATDRGIAEADYDIRRPSHKGGPYTAASVLYNRVTVSKGEGRGKQVFYYTTVDSNPENTYGAIDFKAMDGESGLGSYFEGKYCDSYDFFGCEAAVDESWQRGLEYLVETYDANGKLVSKLKRNYNNINFIITHFGDVWRDEYLPGIIGEGVEPYANVPDYRSNYAGFAAGFPFISSIEMTLYDQFGRGSFQKVINNEYDLPWFTYADGREVWDPKRFTTGFPISVTERNKGLNNESKDLVKEVILADDEILNNKKMSLMFEEIIEKNNDGDVLSRSKINYGVFNDGQIYPESISHFNDDGSESKMIMLDYTDTGKIEAALDGNGNIFYNVYDEYGRFNRSWNPEFGSIDNPIVRKEYYPNSGLLWKTFDIYNQSTTYIYDDFSRLTKIIQQDDSVDSPTLEFIYNNYVSKDEPASTITISKIKEGKTTEQISFFDSLGTEIQTQTKMDNGNYLVNLVVTNVYGEVIKDAKPFIANTGGSFKTVNWFLTNYPNILFTEFFYYDEPLRRLWIKKMPDNSLVEYTYGSKDGLPTVTVQDENHQWTRYTYDIVHNKVLMVEQGRQTI